MDPDPISPGRICDAFTILAPDEIGPVAKGQRGQHYVSAAKSPIRTSRVAPHLVKSHRLSINHFGNYIPRPVRHGHRPIGREEGYVLTHVSPAHLGTCDYR